MSKHMTNTIITIGRQFGSAGLAIGRQVAKDLGLKLYYKEIVDEIIMDDHPEEKKVDTKADKKNDIKHTNSFLYSLVMDRDNTGTYADMPINQKRFISQVDTIKKLAEKGPCVLVGLCADYALADKSNVMSFYIHADIKSRIRRIARIYDVTDAKALDMINETDTKRCNYYNFYTTKNWGQANCYTMCLDSSVLGVEGTAKMIEQIVRLKDDNMNTKL